jgi:hypothetical protein
MERSDASVGPKLSQFAQSNAFWGSFGLGAGAIIMPFPKFILLTVWIALTLQICATDFFEGKEGRLRYIGNAILSFLVGLLLVVVSEHIPTYLGQMPSMTITDVRPYLNSSTNEVCLIPYLKNTGTALAHVEFFQHQLTIAGVQQRPGSPVVDTADFAANGASNRYKICTRDAEAFRQVNNRASLQINFGFRYHGDNGPTQSLCLAGNQWNYALNSLEGNDKPCSVSAKNVQETMMWWAGIILGAFILSVPISLLVIRFCAPLSALRLGASSRGNVDES